MAYYKQNLLLLAQSKDFLDIAEKKLFGETSIHFMSSNDTVSEASAINRTQRLREHCLRLIFVHCGFFLVVWVKSQETPYVL